MTGFNIKGELIKVLRFDEMTAEEIQRSQHEKFEVLKEYACKSEIYKTYYNESYDHFPVITRDLLKKNYEKFLTGIRKPYMIQHSSGSTSNPISICVSKEMLLAKRISHQKMLHWYGLKRESGEFKIGGLKQDLKTQLYHHFKNKKYYNSYQIREDNIPELIKRYNHFKPPVLYGYPSAIYHFVRMAELKSIKLHVPDIIVTHAENLYDYIESKLMEHFPASKIVNQYWSTEANIAVTCPHGRLHVDEDTVIGEIINQNKEGIGDLLITNLYSYDFPIIRYMIGDRVKLSEKTCECGRKTKVIEYIEGREIEMLALDDGRKVPLTAVYLARYSQNILAFHLTYVKKEKKIIFEYLPIDNYQEIDKSTIIKTIKKDFDLETEFRVLSGIEYTNGGKYNRLTIIN
jgi:phenylacetate-CoA ligase